MKNKKLPHQPLVSIIIVNWNGKEVLAECLQSLTNLDYSNWELILIDNGSKDGSEKLVKKYKLSYRTFKLVRNITNLGFAVANNQGLNFCHGKYILLLNNDTQVTPNFITVMVEKMESNPLIGVMQPKIYLTGQDKLLDNSGTFLTITGFLQHWGFMQKDCAQYDSEKLIFSAKGACLLTRLDIVKQIGLFDSDFGSYFEESDFCWRVWLTGYHVIYYPKTHIYHRLGFTSKKMDQISINYDSFKNRIASLIKNLSFAHLLTILLLHIMIVFGLCTYYLSKLEYKKSGMIFSALLWNITNITSTLAKRRAVQSMRIVSDDKIFEQVYQATDFIAMLKHFKKVEANFT